MEENKDILTCKCPHCGESMRIRRPSKEGKYKYVCVHCKQAFAVTYKEEQKEEEKTQTQHTASAQKKETQHAPFRPIDSRYMTIGGLQECRKGLFSRNRMHSLHEGSMIIGRKDNSCPSDIMFDDATMSRQSVKLLVEKKKQGAVYYYTYSLSVLRTKNPVIYNGEALIEGDVVELNIDDTLILGQTKLMLK